MRIEKKIELKHRENNNRVNALYHVYTLEIGAIIDEAAKHALSFVTLHMASMHKNEFNYRNLSKIKHNLRFGLTAIFESAADKICMKWEDKLKNLTLMSRISTVYLSKMSQPPWKPAQLNMNDFSIDDKYDPRKGHVHYAFSNMVDGILKQIQRAAIMQETPLQAIQRVKNLFNFRTKKGVRESNSYDDYDKPLDSTLGPVNLVGGFFTPTDIERLYEDTIKSNNWEHRQYQPYFTDEVRANNRSLYQLEQFLAESAIHVVSDSALKQGTDLENVDDFKWFVSRPGVCKCCDARSGLTMSEIRKKIKDDYGDAPPPIHSRCRCNLAPMMSKKFQDAELSDQGVTYDPETGDLGIPKDVASKYRMDLSLEDFMKQLKSGDYYAQ